MSPTSKALATLQQDFEQLIQRLDQVTNGDLIQQILAVLLRLTEADLDRLDWKVIRSSLRDMERALQVFAPYRHTRKISIFGSARTNSTAPEYQMAHDFAHQATERGFMIMTGAGPGIMEAGNKGAGPGHSFGLNIELPFEPGANSFIEGDPRLIHFKYFFTRKLFLLKESDAVAVFPGGFGTLDEAFECLTLCQTGKSPPIPLVLVDRPGGTYWQNWHDYIQRELKGNGLISDEDDQLYTITDSVEQALTNLGNFYRVYHSCRYVNEYLILRLNQELTDGQIAALNQDFADILDSGTIEKTTASLQELRDEQPDHRPNFIHTAHLPRLKLHFNQRDFGRLYQLILRLNQMGAGDAASHPERK
ncbi:LOG family protein [Thermosynechococcaceae cyanobacterium BACA0444]|uniref:LOG family protein n=1 Tax=Pseudocalidococcus azoricus BACA0444 TaxID=2918990 RepID=A0AAE4JY67_9CYAN|nr:LOG family protein [Pseudocalidococcus azoricus]MDS3860684.1 LOG family protein [Pseudocalidococcus azoricus BACA0444]